MTGNRSEITILHVINQLSERAGAETSLRQIIMGTADNRIRHAVAVLSADDHIPDELAVRAVPVLVPAVSLTGRRAMIRHVVRAIRSIGPDLVHTTLFDADLAGRLAAYWTGVPALTSLVNTAYGPEARSVEVVSAAKLRLVRLTDGALARHATTAFHAISQAAADHAVERLRIRRDLIRVVPRGRSLSSLGSRSPERRRRVRDSLGWGTRPVVINVARQEPQKGHVLLVEAMAMVLRTFPDALLVLVGREGRSTPALRERVAELRTQPSVSYLGVRDDVADLLSAADVFAFSSLYEGLGGALIEAAGVGVPVASYDIPAVREVLGDQHPWLTPAGDVTALAASITEVLRGGPRVDGVAEAQRLRFRERYELEVCVAGMTRLYHDLAAASAGRSSGHRRRVAPVPVAPTDGFV